MTLTERGGIPARAWIDDANAEWDREARSYGPEMECYDPDDDGDDGDGETDDCPTPITTVVPWPGDYDDDRRRVERVMVDQYPLGWLTLPEREALDTLGRYFGPVSFDGRNLVVRQPLAVASWWLDRLGLDRLPRTAEALGDGGTVVAIN